MKNSHGNDLPQPAMPETFPKNGKKCQTPPTIAELSNSANSFRNLTPAALEEISKKYLLHGKFTEYLRLFQSISQKDLDRLPILSLYKATAMLFNEYPRSHIEEEIERVENKTFQNYLTGEIIALRALIQSYTGDPELGIKLSQKALPLISPQNNFFRNLVERNLGIAFTLRGDLRRANVWLEKLLMSSLELNDWGSVLAAYNYLTFVRKVQGKLRDAGVIYKKALDFIEIHNLEMTPHGIKILAGYAHLLLQRHRIDEAKTYCKRAIQYAKQTDILYAHTAYQHLSEAFIQENDRHKALRTIQEIQQISLGRDDLYHQIHLQHMRAVEARIFLEAGSIDNAFDWLVSSGFDQMSSKLLDARYGYELGYILPIAARIYMAKGMVDRAIDILNTTIPKFLHQGAVSFLIRALAALSVAHHTQGQSQKSVSALLRALELGAPENNIGDFIIVGHDLIPLLYDLKKVRLATDFSNNVLSILSSSKPRDNGPGSMTKGITPLSQREMDVLALIAQGMTNREIGISLFLSANTIKSHSIKIYRKLDVNNRNQAVTKARLLGILPTSRSASKHDLPSIFV